MSRAIKITGADLDALELPAVPLSSMSWDVSRDTMNKSSGYCVILWHRNYFVGRYYFTLHSGYRATKRRIQKTALECINDFLEANPQVEYRKVPL